MVSGMIQSETSQVLVGHPVLRERTNILSHIGLLSHGVKCLKYIKCGFDMIFSICYVCKKVTASQVQEHPSGTLLNCIGFHCTFSYLHSL